MNVEISTLPPAPVWERTWETKQTTHFQALYRVYPEDTCGVHADAHPRLGFASVGVRVTVQVDAIYHEQQSYATAEVFDGTEWHPVSGLPPQVMRAARRNRTNTAWAFDLDGLAKDISQLLEESSLALQYRAGR